MASLPRINCHTHTFHLKMMETDWALGTLRRRMIFDHGERLGKVLGDVAVGLLRAIDDLNEETLLRVLLDKLGVDSPLPAGLEEPVLRWLRRRVDRVLDRLRRDPESDFREENLHDTLETIRIIAKPTIGQVTDWLMGQVGPGGAVVPLTMDLTDGEADVTDVAPGEKPLFRQQLEATSRSILAYPGRVLPFVGVHTARPDYFDLMVDGLENLGFVGVKLYPSLGYETDTPEMRRVYEFCEPRGIPLLMHTNTGGFVGRVGANFFPHPGIWETRILPDFPRIKICFAHFGGGGKLTHPFDPAVDDPADLKDDPELPPDMNWSRKILDLSRNPDFPGVYTDVSFHRIAMDSEANTTNYFARLSRLLERDDVGRSILFGTDFWLMRPRLRESSHWRFFEGNLSAGHFARMAVENAARFLGLPGSGERNEAFEAHVRFVANNKDNLAAQPEPWLLAAIEELVPEGAAKRREIEELTEDLRPQRRLFGLHWPELLADVAGKTVADRFERTFATALDRVETDVLGVPVGFTGAGEIRVETLNDADQRDDDVLLLPPPIDASFGVFERRRAERPNGVPIAFRADRAWVKYRTVGRLQADAQAAAGLVSLAVNAEKEVVFTDYRAHARDASLAAAIESDLRRPRFALSRSDVLQLGDGDAVSYATRGRLGGELTVRWGDVFTGGLGVLSKALGARGPLLARMDVGLAFTVRLDVEDDFRISFSRRSERIPLGDESRTVERIRVVARKLAATDRAVSFKIHGGVQLSDPEAVTAALNQLLEQRLGAVMAEVERLLAKNAPVTGADRDLLARLEGELGKRGLAAVRDAVAGLRAKLAEAVVKIARSRLEVGFAYHYNRLETNAVLFEADLSEDAVEQLHHEIVDGDLSGILERARAGDVENVDLHQFLRFREVVERSSWGFHLGPVGGRDFSEERFREHVAILAGEDGRKEQAKKLSFLGLRGYESKWPRMSGELATWRWWIDFRAEMSEFRSVPRAADFEYGLALVVEWESPFFKMELAQWMDAAKVWRALPEPLAVDAVWDGLQELQRQPVLARLQVVFDPATLKALLPEAAAAGAAQRGAALAEAMALHDGQARGSVSDRRRAFSALWQEFLNSEAVVDIGLGSGEKARTWGRKAAQTLERAGLLHAARDERLGPESPSNDRWFLWTFGGLLFLNGSPFDKLERFHRGLERLRAAVGAGAAPAEASHEEVEAIFDDLEVLWKQSHHMRTGGALLAAAAERAGVLENVQSSLTLRHVDEDAGREVLVGIPSF